MSWRTNVDPSLRLYLENQIKEAAIHRNCYLRAENPTTAQIWVAVANLSKQMHNINLKLNYLERALMDIVQINRAQISKAQIENSAKNSKKIKSKKR